MAPECQLRSAEIGLCCEVFRINQSYCDPYLRATSQSKNTSEKAYGLLRVAGPA